MIYLLFLYVVLDYFNIIMHKKKIEGDWECGRYITLMRRMVAKLGLSSYVEDDGGWDFDEKVVIWQISSPIRHFTFYSFLFVVLMSFMRAFCLILLFVFIC